jgi:hypothetical protein
MILTIFGALAQMDARGGGDPETWQRFYNAYPKAVAAVQNSSLGDERKRELLNMLEAGKKTNTVSAMQGNKRKAKKLADESMSILDKVMKIVDAES